MDIPFVRCFEKQLYVTYISELFFSHRAEKALPRLCLFSCALCYPYTLRFELDLELGGVTSTLKCVARLEESPVLLSLGIVSMFLSSHRGPVLRRSRRLWPCNWTFLRFQHGFWLPVSLSWPSIRRSFLLAGTRRGYWVVCLIPSSPSRLLNGSSLCHLWPQERFRLEYKGHRSGWSTISSSFNRR